MKEKFAILSLIIAFLFLNATGAAVSRENDVSIYPVNGEARANQNSSFFSQREVQAIILEGKRALFVERDYKKARKFFEVALSVDVANATACYLLGVVELEEDNLEAARARFRQAHELVNPAKSEQSKFNPVVPPFNSGILPQHTQINRPYSSPLPLENQWISVNGTPMNIGQNGASRGSDGIALPALVKFPSKYRVQVYSQDGWNIPLREETPPASGQVYSGRDEEQTVRKWRENGETVYSFPANSTYRIKVEPNNKSNTTLYVATLVAVAVAGWLAIR